MSDTSQIDIDYENGPSGNCPVQAEGFINGYPFYFRSRHMHWSLRVASDVDGDPFNADSWTHIEEYPISKEDEHYKVAAGYATKEECIEFIERAAKLYNER
jgi:hypothetical protein